MTLSRRRQLVILGTCCLSLALVTMDVTIINVALPAIRSDLHASVAGLQWSLAGIAPGETRWVGVVITLGSTADAKAWIARHEAVFTELLATRSGIS